MNKKKKLVLDKYTQPIFVPSTIYVTKNFSIKDINNRFTCKDPISDEDLSNYDAFVYRCHEKNTNNSVCVVCLSESLCKSKDIVYKVKVCAHEAVHVTFSILSYCGIQLTSDTEEVYAYFEEWVTGCIYKTLTKK